MGLVLAVALCAASGCMVGDEPDDGGAGGYGTGPNAGGGGGGGGGGGSGSGSGGATATVADVLTRMDHAECDSAFACMATFPQGQGVTFSQAFGASAGACYTKFATSYYNATVVAASIAAGKITFNPGAGALCIAGLDAAAQPTCSTLWQTGPSFPAECGDALVGHVAQGGACTSDFECDLTAYCDETSRRCTAG